MFTRQALHLITECDLHWHLMALFRDLDCRILASVLEWLFSAWSNSTTLLPYMSATCTDCARRSLTSSLAFLECPWYRLCSGYAEQCGKTLSSTSLNASNQALDIQELHMTCMVTSCSGAYLFDCFRLQLLGVLRAAP
jgi:hypothetical protein